MGRSILASKALEDIEEAKATGVDASAGTKTETLRARRVALRSAAPIDALHTVAASARRRTSGK